jgi:hypothetical protein
MADEQHRPVSFHSSPHEAMQAPQEEFLYLACLHEGTGVEKPDFLAVVDAERGEVVHELPMPNVGDELHHVAWNRERRRASSGLPRFVSMKEGVGSRWGLGAGGWGPRAVWGWRAALKSLSPLGRVGDRAEWEVRSGGAFPKGAVRRLDENGRLPGRRAGCG